MHKTDKLVVENRPDRAIILSILTCVAALFINDLRVRIVSLILLGLVILLAWKFPKRLVFSIEKDTLTLGDEAHSVIPLRMVTSWQITDEKVRSWVVIHTADKVYRVALLDHQKAQRVLRKVMRDRELKR